MVNMNTKLYTEFVIVNQRSKKLYILLYACLILITSDFV